MLSEETKIEHAILVGLIRKAEDKDIVFDEIAELERLADTANIKVCNRMIQFLDHPNAATYIGSGKLDELNELVKEERVNTIIVNGNLSSLQVRNISKKTDCSVVDRTELILDIFAQHAKTKEAKLQVELAQTEYSYTKLRHLWSHFSRIEGGIGSRGPGEKQIEIDRRLIKKRITILKERIEEIKKQTDNKRKNRNDIFKIALVGYTNAGKSTLFNSLIKDNIYTADQLFATLDSTTRNFFFHDDTQVVLTDTVGFIRDLPHTLVVSFYSTLVDVQEADLLLHIIDTSANNVEQNIESVNKVLIELGASNKDVIYVFNKEDRLQTLEDRFKKKKYKALFKNTVFVSAKAQTGLEELRNAITNVMKRNNRNTVIKIPLEMDDLYNFILRNSELIADDLDTDNNEIILTVNIEKELSKQVKKQVIDYKHKLEYGS